MPELGIIPAILQLNQSGNRKMQIGKPTDWKFIGVPVNEGIVSEYMNKEPFVSDGTNVIELPEISGLPFL